MAIEVLSEISSTGISPRISFSHDLNPKDDAESIEEQHHRRLDASLLGSSSDFDFDFCFGHSFVQELPSADELFSNGKIRPIEIKKKHVHRQSEDPVPSPPYQTNPADNKVKKRLKEFLSMNIDEDDKPATKSIWQFKRSSSLNGETTRSKTLIRPFQFLSRSNSTGSAPNPKPLTTISKETQKQHLQKQPSLSRKSSSSAAFHTYGSVAQKPPLKNCGAHGNGVRVSPVLNLPHPFISNATVNFFGFGSIFCNGKVKRKKR